MRIMSHLGSVALLTLGACSLDWNHQAGDPDAGDGSDGTPADGDAGCDATACDPVPVGDCADPTLHTCDTEPFACRSTSAQSGHECICPAGYDGDGIGENGCTDLDECALGTHTCDQDPVTTCINTVGGFECGPCPEGFAGDSKAGEEGCLPALASLTFSKGILIPAFDPAITEYALDLRTWQDRVDLVATAHDGQTLEIDGSAATSGQAASLSVSATGTNAEVTVASGGSARVYKIAMALGLPEPQYIKASNRSAQDLFGYALAISGDGEVVVAGAFAEDSDGSGADSVDSVDSGAVYVFKRADGELQEVDILKSPLVRAGDAFGQFVALSRDASTLVIGAPNEDSSSAGVNSTPDAAAPNAGAAYVFRRAGDSYEFEAYLKAHAPSAADGFGTYLDVSDDGNTIAVNARNEDGSSTAINGGVDDAAANAGAAYVFQRTSGVWEQQAYIKAFNAGAGDKFGLALDLNGDGNVLAVGAPNEDGSTTRVGTAEDDASMDAGAAYVYRRRGTAWSHEAYLKASNTGTGDFFGAPISISADGNTLVVTAISEDSSATGVNSTADNDLADRSGAAYVFANSGQGWTLQAYIKPSDTEANDGFGEGLTLAASGNLLFVGAVAKSVTPVGGSANAAAGRAYAFARTGGIWTQKTILDSPSPAEGDNFSDMLRIADDERTLVIGAGWEDSSSASNEHPNRSSVDSGAMYVY